MQEVQTGMDGGERVSPLLSALYRVRQSLQTHYSDDGVYEEMQNPGTRDGHCACRVHAQKGYIAKGVDDEDFQLHICVEAQCSPLTVSAYDRLYQGDRGAA